MALALFLIACGGCGSGSGGDDLADGEVHSVLLRWRPSTGVDGYIIHWGHESGVYTDALDVGAPEEDGNGVVSFLLEQPKSGPIFFALTSYDVDGNMSVFSNELAAVVP